MFPHKAATLKTEEEEWAAPSKYILDAGVTKRERTALGRFLLLVKCCTDNKIQKLSAVLRQYLCLHRSLLKGKKKKSICSSY